MSPPEPSLDAILNLSKYHREHEKFYAHNPLEQSIQLEEAARILKTLADRWTSVPVGGPSPGSPYRGCEDLNETAGIQHNGVLFMEGEGEPLEVARLKRQLHSLGQDFEETGEFLVKAMESSWDAALPLTRNPALAGVLGERHRIIANDWHNAFLCSLISRQIRRALEILEKLDLSPAVIRGDLSGPKFYPEYLFDASELLDHAADCASESATLVHDNERRWRVFRQRVEQVTQAPHGP